MEISAQDILINREEAKVPAYTLPDPLQGADGKRVTGSQQWLHQQRPALLKLFADNVYGRMPGKPRNIQFKIIDVDSFALGGTAIRKQVTILFTGTPISGAFNRFADLPAKAGKRTCSFLHWFEFLWQSNDPCRQRHSVVNTMGDE